MTLVCAYQSVKVRSLQTVFDYKCKIENFSTFNYKLKSKKIEQRKNASAIITISLSLRQYRGEIEMYL